jgi:lipid-A-disaccharide synthase
MRIGIVAGETSGDYLAAGVMKALQRRLGDVQFYGIGGPRMQALGMESRHDMESISLMGLDDLLSSMRSILGIRRELTRYFIANPPDVFIGVDVPDFNLGLETKLRAAGIPTVHYVSPTVWAWRGYRIAKIRRAVTHMLTLFPFEADYYKQRKVPATFVGHPIADDIPEHLDRAAIRRALGLSEQRLVALLPGSRISELRRLARLFLETAVELRNKYRDLQFVAPMASDKAGRYFEHVVRELRPDISLAVIQGHAREALAAADVALIASGTAALEAGLVRTPMVVTYKVSPLTALLVRGFSHVEYYSMPNNLLPEPIVPELLQDKASVGGLVSELSRYLGDRRLCEQTRQQLGKIRGMLARDANERAADAIVNVLEARS